MAKICKVYGYTRQAYYKRKEKMKKESERGKQILEYVLSIRKRQPRVGGRKLHEMINSSDRISAHVGRDSLFTLLRTNDLLVKQVKRWVKTTNSYHRFKKYGNLIKEKEDIRPGEVLVSDITYIDTEERYGYLFLTTDYASRAILGYNFSRTLRVEGGVKALEMAIKNIADPEKVIHHSDRGKQYCSYIYTDLLKKNNMQISMTEKNHVYENALAERVNGILKQEFLLGERLPSLKIAEMMIEEAISIYNYERLHTSLNYEIPMNYFNENVNKYAA